MMQAINKPLSCLALLLLIATLFLATPSAAQQPNRVGLMVQFGDGRVETRCISFTEDEITGIEVLQRSGLDLGVDYNNVGAAVCSIDGAGCPTHDCLTCDPNDHYWSYWRREADGWRYATRGAAGQTVRDGDVEGWRWGAGDPPGHTTFAAICPPPVTATATVAPTATPTAAATPTALPTVLFWADGEAVPAGTCTTVHWRAENVRAVALNGDPVAPSGFVTTCPCETVAFDLTITHLDDAAETRALTITTTGSCEAPASPTATPTATHSDGEPPSQPTPTATSQPPTQTPPPTATYQPPTQTPTVIPTRTPTPDAKAVTTSTGQPEGNAEQLKMTALPATPTRAAVEGFAAPAGGTPAHANFPASGGLLVFGVLLTVIGVSYVAMVKRS